MSSDETRTHIAHVLFTDIVAYTRLPIERQAAVIRELQEAVAGAEEYGKAEEAGDLVTIPTGDGMALVFFGDPTCPARCAVQIAAALADHPALKLRMGIHTGPVSRVTDINGKENVSGPGINTAQRVMDCAEAGHILLSRAYAEVLREFGEWEPQVHELGEAVAKHGERVQLFALRLDRRSPETKPKAVLLYKRSAQPDEYVLALIEKELSAHGYEVFLDRRLPIGVEWAREIERKIREADAIIPLVSEASIGSEMLEYELEIAQKSREETGKPRLLPIRVAFEGALPPGFSRVLGPLQYELWQTGADDRYLVEKVLASLVAPAGGGLVAKAELEPVGGAVPLDSKFYVERPVDAQFGTAMQRRDSIVLIKGARQMGKTSLLARGLEQARASGAKVVLTDFQTLNEAHLQAPDSLFLALGAAIAAQLGVPFSARSVWDPDLGPSLNMEMFFRRVLDSFEEPLVWSMDEVDRLFTTSFGGEVFALFRTWHNKRALEPAGPWSRLTLAIAYATEAFLFITDLNQSPFNVGTRLSLDDFTLEQVGELNRRYGEPLRTPDEASRFHRLVAGQPYLVRRGLDDLVTREMSFTTLEEQADRDEGLFGDHLRRLLVSLSRDPALTEVVRGVLRGEPCPDADSFYRLRSAGVVVGGSAHEVRPRCELYERYLKRHLL